MLRSEHFKSEISDLRFAILQDAFLLRVAHERVVRRKLAEQQFLTGRGSLAAIIRISGLLIQVSRALDVRVLQRVSPRAQLARAGFGH